MEFITREEADAKRPYLDCHGRTCLTQTRPDGLREAVFVKVDGPVPTKERWIEEDRNALLEFRKTVKSDPGYAPVCVWEFGEFKVRYVRTRP